RHRWCPARVCSLSAATATTATSTLSLHDALPISWMQEDAGGQSLWLARFAHDLGREHWRLKVADVPGRGRGTGVPRLRLRGGEAWLAWTVVEAGQPSLRGARVAPP